MAIRLQLSYGGELVCELPIYITHSGWYVKALLKPHNGDDQENTGHIWRNSKHGTVGYGVSTVNSLVDKDLEISVVADTEDDIIAGEFIVLEHVLLELIEQ